MVFGNGLLFNKRRLRISGNCIDEFVIDKIQKDREKGWYRYSLKLVFPLLIKHFFSLYVSIISMEQYIYEDGK